LIRIPMQPANRSINLSNAVAIVAYETWRQANFIGDDKIISKKHFS
jgi:tRNA (cytidine/uridine-2'-O-)-methyltransferase